MEPLTYNLQSDSKNYYGEISKFTSQVLKESEGFLGSLIEDFQSYAFENSSKNLKKEESVLEALMIGVFWNSYANRSTQLDERPQKLMASLSHLRNDIPDLKEEIDDVRGLLITMFLLEDNSEEDFPELSIENLNLLLKWLEATGDYNHELKHLKVWEDFLSSKDSHETAVSLTRILMFADWFHEASHQNLSQFTPHVNDYIRDKLVEHLDKEDMIFCGRKQVEYHLNMVGAEIMNRAYRESFESRPRKAVLVPGCMRYHNSHKCAAKEDKLGFKCVMCNKKCSVAQITSKGLKEGFEIYIVSHESSAFSQSTPKDQDELGIVGVACVNNLVSGGWKSDALGIPAQCVILENVGCQNHWQQEGFPTQINQNELEKILAI